MIKTLSNKFRNADEAFQYWYQTIEHYGTDFAGTKALFNIGFEIQEPRANAILNNTVKRNWSIEYAEAEWQWYLSGDRNIARLGKLYGKVPAIWKRMADADGNVNSNYGWQWDRNGQLDKVIGQLQNNPDTRQAAISIYDGKEISNYTYDTPCTYAVQFTILHGRLDMCVTMRSNDLWYGFCNDQYQFSKLQEMISKRLNIETGVYYHFAHNMHLYNDKI